MYTKILKKTTNLLFQRTCTTAKHPPVKDVLITDVHEKLRNIMGIERGFKPTPKSREFLRKYEPKTQQELPPRTMQDSFQSIIVPLSTDPELQNRYVAFQGRIRLGKCLEDMDLMAVWVAQKHIVVPNLPPNTPLPYSLVTVLVDKMEYTDYITRPDQDIRLSGHVSLVGTSTMEVVVWLEQRSENGWSKMTRALFLMAARNAINTGATPVNPIKPGNAEEEKILSGGHKRKESRNKVEQNSLFKAIPTADEQKIVHEYFKKTMTKDSLHSRTLPPEGVWMESTRLTSLVMSHPQDRNLHNKVFGGYLMRNAFELSWYCILLFAKQQGRLLYISDILFRHPVNFASILKMHSYVVYTQDNLVQALVYAEIFDERDASRKTSNMFHFLFELPTKVSQVYPRTYQECIMYLDGRRHFLDCLNPSRLDHTHDFPDL